MNSENLPTDTRRDFVKRSLVSALIVAQPTILTGILRAQGGGGSTIASTNWDVQGSITVNGSAPNLTSFAANQQEPARHYGESGAQDVGQGYSCKAKVWATPSLHSGTVKLSVSGEIFKTVDGSNSATTDRIALEGTIYNYATGELNAPSPNPLSVDAVSPTTEIKDEFLDSSGAAYKFVYTYWVSLIGPSGNSTSLNYQKPTTKQAYVEGRVRCVKFTSKYLKAIGQDWEIDDNYDPPEPGVWDIPFKLQLDSHFHPAEGTNPPEE